MHLPADPVDRIHVQELEVFARVGVTENERAKPQRLTISVTVWLRDLFENLGDDISRTANYSTISVAVRDFVQARPYQLIETLAAELADHLLHLLPVQQVALEVRKFVLPEARYAAVMVTRSAAVG